MAQSLETSAVNNPPVIYHYTNATGLIGILSSGKLWATDIRYLNDSSELRHAEGLHRQVLKKIIAESVEGSLSRSLATKALGDRYPVTINPQNYVTSFCAEDDLLTQWQGYGSRGSGFSIGFDRERLKSALQTLNPPAPTSIDVLFSTGHPASIALEKVVYSEEEQRSDLRLAFDRQLKRLTTEPSGVNACAKEISAYAARSASRFKHPAFEAEKEWRIIISSPSSASPKLCFRPSARTVIPYLETNKQPDRKLPIVSVTIGPTLDSDLSIQSVFALLGAKGYLDKDPIVQIIPSEVPLARA